MNWRVPDQRSWTALRERTAGWLQELLQECQSEWRSRPLIRHMTALALCLLVVLVGVLERSTRRAPTAAALAGMGRAVATTGVPIAVGRAATPRRIDTALSRTQ